MGNLKNVKTININTATENPVVWDVLAEDIIQISNAIKKMKSSKLSERALVIIIADASNMSQTAVKNLLHAIEHLPDKYLKKS